MLKLSSTPVTGLTRTRFAKSLLIGDVEFEQALTLSRSPVPTRSCIFALSYWICKPRISTPSQAAASLRDSGMEHQRSYIYEPPAVEEPSSKRQCTSERQSQPHLPERLQLYRRLWTQQEECINVWPFSVLMNLYSSCAENAR